MPASRRHWLLAALIVLMVLTAYVPALESGYIWDDDVYVTDNRNLRTTEGLWRSWTQIDANIQYYPLVFTSFWLEYHLWEHDPFGYHLVNVVLHLLNALLIWRILLRLGIPGAWLAAAIFAVHPVHVESVAWITERKNVLSSLFYLGAVSFYLRFADWRMNGDTSHDSRVSGRAWAFYAFALVSFVCALLSKTVTASLPAALLVIAWWKRGALGKRDVVPLVPFFVLGALMGSLTVWLERAQVGATGPEWELSLIERGLVAGTAVWFYLGKLLLPIKLTFSYPRWSIDAAVWWQYILPVAAVATMIFLYLQRARIGRGPVAAAVFFILTLAPALGFIDFYPMRYSFVADHFQYLASIGPIVLISTMVAGAIGRFTLVSGQSFTAAKRLTPVVLGALLLVTLAFFTWKQSSIYRNPETLWSDTIAKNPRSWMAYNNLGLYYFRQLQWERAVPNFREAVRIKPDHAEAHYNLSLALYRLGRDAEAYSHYMTATRLRPGIGLAPRPRSRRQP